MQDLPGAGRSPELAAERLGSRVGKSGGWVLVGRLLARSSGFVTTAVLARLLTPDAFGIVGFALVANGLFEAFSQFGLKEYLIQRPGRTRPLLGPAWAVILMRSAAITALLVLTAPWLAAAFNMPEATNVLRAIAFIPLIRGMSNIEAMYFIKRLEFHKQFVLDAAPQLGILVVGVSLALLWGSVWALVVGHLAGALLECALSYVMCRSVPRPRFSAPRARLMFRFGLFVFLSSIAGYFTIRGGEWIVAWLFDSHALGLYVLAVTIMRVPSQDLVKPLGRILFPTFALVRDQPERLRSVFLRGYGLVVASTAPLCLGLILVSGDFAAVVLGPQWLAITPILAAVGVAALGHNLSTASSGLFYALGRPEISVVINLVGVAALLAVVIVYLVAVPGEDRTVLAMAMCVVAAQLANYTTRLLVTVRLIGIGLGRLLSANLATLSALAAMALGVLAVQAGLGSGLLRLVASVVVGGLLYVGCQLIFWIALHRGPLADMAAVLAQVRRTA
jgi:O-antigen/teichoic acid export membrane protein